MSWVVIMIADLLVGRLCKVSMLEFERASFAGIVLERGILVVDSISESLVVGRLFFSSNVSQGY